MGWVTKSLAVAALALAALGQPAAAQNAETLADIRQQLTVLYVEIQRLRRELSTTGTPGVAVGGATALERMDRIEAELRRMTARTEEMEARIGRIVEDGTNQIGDLEFRLCELEPACDIASLGDTPRLGGDTGAIPIIDTGPLPSASTDPAAEMAMGEQADFDAAKALYDAGDYGGAAAQFGAFIETYPGGPLNAEAHYLRGEALTALGSTADAGRAYLDSFSGSPDGPRAPDALLKLGVTLGDLGQVNEACVMLAQVGARFPGAAQAGAAQQQLQALGCS